MTGRPSLDPAFLEALKPYAEKLVREQVPDVVAAELRRLLPRLRDAGVISFVLDDDAVFAEFDKRLNLAPRRGT